MHSPANIFGETMHVLFNVFNGLADLTFFYVDSSHFVLGPAGPGGGAGVHHSISGTDTPYEIFSCKRGLLVGVDVLRKR